MPAPPTIQNYDSTLERRVENSARAAMRLVNALDMDSVDIRVRDEEDPILQADADLQRPLVVIQAQDNGRIGLTPIRKIELRFTVRASREKAPADVFNVLCANVEEWLDNTNLITQLTNADIGVHVFVAVREPGTTITLTNNLREHTYSLSIKAVGLERTFF